MNEDDVPTVPDWDFVFDDSDDEDWLDPYQEEEEEKKLMDV